MFVPLRHNCFLYLQNLQCSDDCHRCHRRDMRNCDSQMAESPPLDNDSAANSWLSNSILQHGKIVLFPIFSWTWPVCGSHISSILGGGDPPFCSRVESAGLHIDLKRAWRRPSATQRSPVTPAGGTWGSPSPASNCDSPRIPLVWNGKRLSQDAEFGITCHTLLCIRCTFPTLDRYQRPSQGGRDAGAWN